MVAGEPLKRMSRGEESVRRGREQEIREMTKGEERYMYLQAKRPRVQGATVHAPLLHE
jgi:hypothetical protein